MKPTAPDHEDRPTPCQGRVYEHIYNTTRDTGRQPSVREVMEALGIRSPNGVTCFLKQLAARGYVRLAGSRGRGRGLRFLRRPDGVPFTGFSDKGGAT